MSLTLEDCKLDSANNLHDFKGLTEMYIINSGENLDWSELADIDPLVRVYVSASTEQTVPRRPRPARMSPSRPSRDGIL